MKLTKQMSYKTQFEKMDRHTGGKWFITALITTISAISCKARDFHVDYEFDLKTTTDEWHYTTQTAMQVGLTLAQRRDDSTDVGPTLGQTILLSGKGMRFIIYITNHRSQLMQLIMYLC